MTKVEDVHRACRHGLAGTGGSAVDAPARVHEVREPEHLVTALTGVPAPTLTVKDLGLGRELPILQGLWAGALDPLEGLGGRGRDFALGVLPAHAPGVGAHPGLSSLATMGTLGGWSALGSNGDQRSILVGARAGPVPTDALSARKFNAIHDRHDHW